MKQNKLEDANLGFAALLCVFGIAGLALTIGVHVPSITQSNDPGARLFPGALSVLILTFGAYEAARWFWIRRRSGNRRSAADVPRSAAIESSPATGAILVGGMIGYFLLMPWLGFGLSTSLFCLAVMRLLKAGWKAGLATALVLPSAVFLLFVQLFHVQLPPGRLGLPF